MKKIISFSLSLFIISTTIKAQNTMKTGWVVTNSGDTINCLINYKQWNVNPQKLDCKTDKLITYKIGDLKAFGVPGEDTYQRFAIKRHPLPMNDADNIPDNEDSIVTSSEWLRIIINGGYGLAEFRTPERPYFYSIEGTTAEELVYYKGIKSYTSDKYLQTSYYGKTLSLERTTFRNQLSALAEKITSKKVPIPENLRYTEYELSNYLNKMNGFNGKIIKSSKSNWGITAGVCLDQYSFSGFNGLSSFSGTAKTTISPLIALNYTILSTRNQSRTGVMLDLGVTTINTTGNSTPFSDVTHEIHVKNTYVQFTATPFYIFTPISPTQFYVGAGLRVISLVSSNNSIIQKNLTSGLTTTLKDQPGAKSLITGQLITGIISGRLNYYLSYSPTGNISTNAFASLKNNRIAVSVRIQLGH